MGCFIGRSTSLPLTNVAPARTSTTSVGDRARHLHRIVQHIGQVHLALRG
jgi:hypothetical protein